MNKIKAIASKYCKNKFLRVTVRPFWRLYAYYSLKLQKYFFRKNALKLLTKLTKICEENKIVFWLEFGTLLGAVRDKDFIGHDYDLDIGVMGRDREKLEKLLVSNGFKLKRQFNVINSDSDSIEQTYQYKHVLIDVFYFHHKDEETLFCYSFSPIIGEEKYKNLSEVKTVSIPNGGMTSYFFKGLSVNIPKKTEEHLIMHYGKDYKIPIKNFDYRKTASNIKYFSRDEKLARYVEF